MKETIGDTAMYFAYDADGKPMSVLYDDVTYYYVTNLQGDVVAVLSNTGELVVSYTYDAWGNPLTTSGTMAETLGTHNPLRYRGYVYDAETGLYYLQSRYYDPQMGRFINADNYPSTGQGLLGNNMFAYCNNNPANASDPDGKLPLWAVAAIGGAVGGALLNVTLYLTAAGDDATWGGATVALIAGGISGALGGAAGMVTDALTKASLIVGAGAVSGIYADFTGGSAPIGAIFGSASAFCGTLFSSCGFVGFDLGFVNYMTTILTGFGAEGLAQLTNFIFAEQTAVAPSQQSTQSANSSTVPSERTRKVPYRYVAYGLD